MPTLHWIGKNKIINHHQEVPYKVLNHQYHFGDTETSLQGDGNMIVNGDNLEALKSLLPKYEGKVKCIYIDPPYNTGNEGWVYNDNVNSPQIQKWFAKAVGKESEDLTRHDKWLCMMYPRLRLLHKLLANDGAIFISIDDNELANLKLVMDEIFGAGNFIEYFSWIKTSTAPSLAKKSRKTTEYILCYEKRKTDLKYKAEGGDGGDAPLLNTGNSVVELQFPKEKVFFKVDDFIYKPQQFERVKLNNEIEIIDGYANQDIKLTGEFKWTQQTLDKEILNGTTFIIKSEKFAIRYLRETETFKAPTNLLKEKYYTPLIDKRELGVETNEGAKKEIIEIFGKSIFDYPKPSSLVEFFLKFIEDKNSIILDSFAGSGTTAHAVLNLNKQDGGNRKFILIEMEDYAETITAERVKRVINGYSGKEGTGGSFDYYTLGETLFNEDHNLNEVVSEEVIKEYVWFAETKEVYQKQEEAYLLGTKNNIAYYFYYEKEHLTTLDETFLRKLKTKASQYIIYADVCLLNEKLMEKYHIVFKKIPRDISKL